MAEVAGAKGRKKRGDQSFARFINLLEDYKDRGIWDRYLELAGAAKLQEAVAAEAARTGEIDVTGPLRVLDDAIERAAGLGRIADAAGLTLSRARWTRRLEQWFAPAMLQPGGPGVAHELTGDLDREQLVLYALLRTWELHDGGNPGAARATLGDLVRGETPVLRPGHGDGWAVPLLRHALAVDADLVGALLRRPLVDDNVLTDLSHALIEAGELSHARTAALAIRLFTGNKVKALGEIAVRQAQAGDRQACADTDELARRAAADASDAGDSFIFQGRTLLAAARVLCSPPDGGRSAFAEVTAEASQQARAAEALAEVATAQVRAGLLADAERTIAMLPDDDPRWEAAATLVAALAERGDVIGARQALSYVWDNALCYPRAVRALAGAVARADPVSAERLAKDLPRASACGYVLAEVATAARAAGHREEAVCIATGIQDPGWQARALVDLARVLAPDEALPGPRVLDAISGVPDAGTRAVLLAQYAVTCDGVQRAHLLADAKKLACEGDPDERWSTLAEIALTEADAGVPDAAQTFAAARTRVLADPEVEERHLRELCRLQELAGDSAGARQTVAAALPRIATSSTARFGAVIGASLAAARARLAPPRGVAWAAGVDGPEPDTDRLLAPVTLAAIAGVLAQSMAADPNAVGPGVAGASAAESVTAILATAARLAGALRGEQRVTTVEALAHAHLAAGDLDTAERTVLSLLPAEQADEDGDWDDEDLYEDDDWDEDEEDPADTLLTAIRVGVTVVAVLTAKGERARAAALLRHYTGRLAKLNRDPEYWPAEACAVLAVAQASAGAADDARATAALDPTGTAEAALAEWETGSQETPGRETAEQEAAEAERAGTDPGWQAVMLVTSALATLPPDSAAHDRAAGYSAARPLDFEAALLLINAVAEGAPRTRVQLEVIDRLVAAGQYAVAARLAESLSADVGAHLARIILTLGAEATDTADAGSPARSAEAARAAVLSMLPQCSRYPRSAHATCVALAMAFPSASVAIADAVQRNAAAAAAPAPEG